MKQYVRVSLDLKTRVLSNRDVVTPCRGRKVDRLASWEESGQEGGTDSQSTSTGDGLSNGQLPMSHVLTI